MQPTQNILFLISDPYFLGENPTKSSTFRGSNFYCFGKHINENERHKDITLTRWWGMHTRILLSTSKKKSLARHGC